MVLVWLAACGSFDVIQEPAGPTPEEIALEQAGALAKERAQTMQAAMVQNLATTAPDALTAGSAEVDALAWHQVGKLPPQGRVGISALELRNPANRPPEWVKAWLEEREGRQYADVAGDGFARIEDGPDGKVARVLEPIPVLEQCIRCHGDEEEIPADVRTALEQRYPNDKARGYEVGDLRGAVWSEVAVAE